MRCGFTDHIIELLDEVPRGVTLLEIQYCYLSHLLKKNKGNKTHTALEAGICLTTMKRRAREMRYFEYHVEPMNVKFGPKSKDYGQ